MGTYTSISIGGFDFLSSKNSFGDLLTPFSPMDLIVEEAINEFGEKYNRRYLSTTVSKVKLILDSCGFTVEAAKEDFAKLKAHKLDFIQYCLKENTSTLDLSYEDVYDNFTFENWYQATLYYAKSLSRGQCHLDFSNPENPTITEKILLDSLPYGESFWGFCDVKFCTWNIFRVILDAFPSNKSVTLDYTDLFESGWCDEIPTKEEFDVPKTIILTEGKFDSEVISKAIDLLYPHMSKFYSFMNFSEYKVQGSTNFLTHYLKAFVASGIQNRVIALYDNDSAGLSEIIDLVHLQTPNNFRIMHLPDIELAKNYPTIGPNGEECLDINGKACSIELFMGADVLTESNKLTPIHWRGFNDKTKTYQGEVMSKGLIQSKFFKKCNEINYEIQEDDETWQEMRLLLTSIFNIFN